MYYKPYTLIGIDVKALALNAGNALGIFYEKALNPQGAIDRVLKEFPEFAIKWVFNGYIEPLEFNEENNNVQLGED